MPTAEVRDHSLWIKHVTGDDALVSHLSALPPGAAVWLRMEGVEGQWLKMAAQPSGAATPGLKPTGRARDHWHELLQSRGQRVEIGLADAPPFASPTSVETGGLVVDHLTPAPTGVGRRVALPEPVARIYEAVRSLEATYPGRKFTPDGHLVGSIGEVVAAEALGLTLHPASYPGHDAVDPAGRQVQIKLTSGNSVSLYACCDRLVVLRIVSPVEAEVVFDGDGEPAWNLAGGMQKNGQRVISLAKLRKLSATGRDE